ncbi:hypothetical protein MWH25_05270 [Natroniella acetigena]|uniref:hypothetical protein n=1 Tax=Natroniella acetigena TaxID=52004 RepID=UPI00200A34E4|nr:hypothetical protein [Natroniella acetigena]MCK8827153.1 hypothetical protein [Natroniella acetigena]
MRLYALKSDKGYLKDNKNGGYQLVTLNKASVFARYDSEKLNQLKEQAEKDNLSNLRLSELKITEKEVEF